MSTWTDKGRPLAPDEINDLLRDACAQLGKCTTEDDPDELMKESPEDLNFDDPPLKGRPNHQKRALSYVVVALLNNANVYISPGDLWADYFVEKSANPLKQASTMIAKAQEYPARG